MKKSRFSDEQIIAQAPDDAPLRAKIRELAAQRRRFGYRRIHLMLKRQGEAMNLNLGGNRRLGWSEDRAWPRLSSWR